MTAPQSPENRALIERDIAWLQDQKDVLHPLQAGQWSAKNERIDRITAILARSEARHHNTEGAWVTVPREPTKAMTRAGQIAGDDKHWAWRGLGPRDPGEGLDGMTFVVRDAYAAMLAAAPVPPHNTEGEAVARVPLGLTSEQMAALAEHICHARNEDPGGSAVRFNSDGMKSATFFEIAHREAFTVVNWIEAQQRAHANATPDLAGLRGEVESLREALKGLEWSCEQLAATRDVATYEAMIANGQADATIALDNARRVARDAIRAQHPPQVGVMEGLKRSPAIEELTPTNWEWDACVSVQDRYDLMKRKLDAALSLLQPKGGK